MNDTDFGKKYTPSLFLSAAGILLRGLPLFFIVWAVKDILSFLLSESILYDGIYRLLTFPVDLILSLLLIFLYFAPRMTCVQVGRSEIRVKRWFQKPQNFPLSSHEFVFTKKIGNKTIKNELFYMEIKKTSDREQASDQKLSSNRSHSGKKRFRLVFFRKSDFTALSSAIHAAIADQVPVEVRSEAAWDDLQTGRTEFPFPRQKILRASWKEFFLSSAVILAAVASVYFLRSYFIPLYWYFLVIVCSFLLLGIPVNAVRILFYQKKCPHTISRHGTFLFFDDTRFSVSEIQTLRMTAANAVPSSIFPKMRTITITAGGKKHHYWVGSTRNMTRAEYEKLCQWIERAFMNNSSKVIYDQK
ncbi:MAG: hypothetical protein NC293_09565 [Roseburia sp.]|nr:hypothetical protein [Roseburia sp.]